MLRKYFFKRFISYFQIMFLPTLLVFIVIGYFLVASQQKAVEEKGPVTLRSFEESMEVSLYNMGYQLDVMMSNSSFSLSLKNLLSDMAMNQKEQIFYNVLKNFLSTYEYSYSYIHSVYLYIEGKELFMTSASGQIVNINTYYDLEWLEEYQEMGEGERIFTSRRWIKGYTYDEPTEVISIYYQNTYLNGVIVINIDKGEYGKLLRSVLTSEEQKVFLLNRKGDMVCSTDQSFETMNEENPLAEQIAEYTQAGKLEAMTNQWLKIGNEYYYLYMHHSEYLDIYQVSAVSIAYLFEELKFYIFLAIVVLILNLAVITTLAYFYTKRSFYYIEECVNIFSAAERGEVIEPNVGVIKDEYSMILNNIIFLYIKHNQIQIDLMEKQHAYEITETMALQLQINPHFIFNTLQIMDIEVVRKIGQKSTLHKMTQQLSRVVKYALTNPAEEVSLHEELEYLRAYLDIQQVRFDNNAITYFEVDDSVLDSKVFRLLLQPMLENCFEHARRSSGERIMIKIKIHDRGEFIYFTVVDSGKGMNKQELAELYQRFDNSDSRSIGLTNLNRRLILHYGSESRLVIQSKKETGMIVHFQIPKK